VRLRECSNTENGIQRNGSGRKHPRLPRLLKVRAGPAFTGPTTLGYAGTDVTTNNEAITFNGAVTLAANTTINSGTATTTFDSTVDGDYNLTATAGTFSLGAAWGSQHPLSAVSLTSINSLTLPAISAGSITAVTTGASADLTLSGQLTASGTGTPVVLATEADFDNTAGSTAINLTGSGSPRWLIYSDSETPDGLTPASTVYNQTYISDPPGSVTETGNTWIYAQYFGTLDITADAQAITYGQQIPTLSYGCSGGGCGGLTGALTTSGGSAGAYPNAGSYTISQGTLSEAGYVIDFTGNTLTVNTATLTVTANSGQHKTYGTSDPALTYSYSGLENDDTSSVFSGSLTRANGQNVGAYAIGQGTLSAGSNYTIDYTGASFTINPATLTVTANNENKAYGVALPALTYSYSGLVGGDNSSVFSGALATAATASSNAGNYAITEGTLSAGGNYNINFTPGTLAILGAPIVALPPSVEAVFALRTEVQPSDDCPCPDPSAGLISTSCALTPQPQSQNDLPSWLVYAAPPPETPDRL
jgi:hypothetical protein